MSNADLMLRLIGLLRGFLLLGSLQLFFIWLTVIIGFLSMRTWLKAIADVNAAALLSQRTVVAFAPRQESEVDFDPDDDPRVMTKPGARLTRYKNRHK